MNATDADSLRRGLFAASQLSDQSQMLLRTHDLYTIVLCSNESLERSEVTGERPECVASHDVRKTRRFLAAYSLQAGKHQLHNHQQESQPLFCVGNRTDIAEQALPRRRHRANSQAFAFHCARVQVDLTDAAQR